MEQEMVVRRRWMSRSEFLDHLGVVQLLPGPNSTELAIHVGHARAGWRGGVAAGLAFLLPSVTMVWALAALAGTSALLPALTHLTWWMVPVVVAVLLRALWSFGQQSVTRPHAAAILPIVTCVALFVAADMWTLLCGAGVAILLSGRGRRETVAVVLALGGGVAIAAGTLLAQSGPSAPADSPGSVGILLYFLRVGVSVFGSGYVLLSFLQHELVDVRGWLTPDALAQATAFAQLTPGPLFSTATAVGFTLGGHAGALAATVGVFAPAFLSVAVSAPLRRMVHRSAALRAALDGVILASVALLGRAVAGFAWPMRSWQWLVCGLAVGVLFRTRVSASVLLSGAAVIGIAAYFLHVSPS
jgi:chromate transporter